VRAAGEPGRPSLFSQERLFEGGKIRAYRCTSTAHGCTSRRPKPSKPSGLRE
jgi:hypothetical protein